MIYRVSIPKYIGQWPLVFMHELYGTKVKQNKWLKSIILKPLNCIVDFKQVLEDYTTPGPEHRGLTSMKIISHDYGYLESRTGYYESGITEFFQGQKVVQKNK